MIAPWANNSYPPVLLATSRRRSLMNRMSEMDKQLNEMARVLSELDDLTATKSLLVWLIKTHGIQNATPLAGIHEQSDVFVLTAGDGSELILKAHQQLAAAKREFMAYRMLSGVGFQSVPQLVDVWSEDARFLLLEKMPGTPAMTASSKLYGRAGQLLDQLHKAPYRDLDSMPLAEAYVRRGTALFQHLLESSERSLLETCIRVLGDKVIGRRVMCHRDYRRRNWLIAPGADEISLIDFGQCRADYYLCDFVHVYMETMACGLTSSWHAFVEGYGRTLKDDERSILSALIGLYGLTTLVRIRRGQGQGCAVEGTRYCAVSRRLMNHRSSC